MSRFEKQLYKQGYKIIAGVDEAGRGPLAGPVVACACILPENFFLSRLNDSKLLTPTLRKHLFHKIVKNPRVIYSIGIVEADVIDQINILQATLKAMKEAILSLSIKPEYVLFDGKQIPYIPDIASQGIIHGDQRSISIAAASIIAKETRDRIMNAYDTCYPPWDFKHHKGYGTEKHLEALILHGPSPIHRMSFSHVKSCFADEELMLPFGEITQDEPSETL